MAKHRMTSPITKLIVLDCVTALTVLLLICLGGSVTDYLDIVSSPLLVAEILCTALLIMNLVKISVATESTAFFPASTKSKTIRSKLQRTLMAGGTLVLSLLLFHTIIILFGAPVIQSASETFHLSCLLTVTSTLPCVCTIGPSIDLWTKTWASYCKSREFTREFSVLVVSVCSVAGAWLGAFPIPLDWDRPWQIWPVSCLIGTAIGHCAGLIIASVSLIREQQVKGRSKLI